MICQEECQIKSQNICQIECQVKRQKERHVKCQVECQIKFVIERWNICHKFATAEIPWRKFCFGGEFTMWTSEERKMGKGQQAPWDKDEVFIAVFEGNRYAHVPGHCPNLADFSWHFKDTRMPTISNAPLFARNIPTLTQSLVLCPHASAQRLPWDILKRIFWNFKW